MNYPDKYNFELFGIWYQKHFQVEIGLKKEVENIQLEANNYFNTRAQGEEDTIWGKFLYVLDILLEQIKLDENILYLDFEPSPDDTEGKKFESYYIKSVDSILNKVWRKNKKYIKEAPDKVFNVNQFKANINDLVRFSLKAKSFKTAELFAKGIKKITEISGNPVIKNFREKYLEKVIVDNELKMDSGYFAYHCLFFFKSGFIVELQIFSELSNYWRGISHNIYEKLRLEPKETYEFNDIESRLVSIGHLLYLADCELYRIEQELGLKK